MRAKVTSDSSATASCRCHAHCTCCLLARSALQRYSLQGRVSKRGSHAGAAAAMEGQEPKAMVHLPHHQGTHLHNS